MLKKLPFKPSQVSLSPSGFFAFILLLIILISLLGIVFVQHQIRHLETEYALQLQDRKNAQEEWGRLTLEKHHLSAPARVEQLARDKLNMSFDKHNQSDQRQTVKLYIDSSNSGNEVGQ